MTLTTPPISYDLVKKSLHIIVDKSDYYDEASIRAKMVGVRLIYHKMIGLDKWGMTSWWRVARTWEIAGRRTE